MKTFRSPLKLVIDAPLEGRKEKTLFAPLEPEYKFLHSVLSVNGKSNIIVLYALTKYARQGRRCLPQA